MSSKRDLVEAHGYNRRRLITAFVSGAPGGREVEPVRYGRTIVGGVVLALILVAGAAVSGFLKPAVPKDWAKEGLVIGKTSGSRFYAFDNTLYPIINITSAKLLLSKDSEPKLVPDDLISSQKLGATIGIAGAPEVLPGANRLVEDGWTACTNAAGGVALTLARSPVSRPATGQALRVVSGKTQYVIAGARRYPVPADLKGLAALRAIGLDAQQPVPVPGLWLDLVPEGTALTAPQVEGDGTRVDTGVAGLDTAGTPVEVDGRRYVLSRTGTLLEMTDFAAAIYGAGREQVSLSSSEVASVRTDPSGRPYPADWPEAEVSAYSEPTKPCLQLEAATGEAPVVRLATATSEDASSTSDAVERNLEVGSGAVVRATTGGVLDSGAVQLIDASGTSYALAGGSQDRSALAALGYGKVTPVPVPKSWLDLFLSGPELSVTAASRTPQGGS